MDGTVTILEKHPLILRCVHWLNFVFLALMVWSGILIYWAHQPYVQIPETFAERLNIDHRLAEGMGWHFFIMWPFIINGSIYVIWLIKSKEWKQFFFHHSTQGKFNRIQGLAYFAVLMMACGSVITGLAIYRPVQAGWLTSMLGGYQAARFEHFLLMTGFVFFFFVHVIQVFRAGWNTFRGMVAGYEINKDRNQ